MIDTIIYETKNNQTRIALMGGGELKEVDISNAGGVQEGNIYLGKIVKKLELANGKIGYMVNIGEDHDAFLNAEEYGLNDAEYTEGQSLIVKVAQERHAEKGAKVVRSLQFVGENMVYCPYQMNVEASSKIADQLTLADYKRKVMEHTTGQEGWILRTSAVEVPFEKIAEEMLELRKIYDDLRIKARTAKAPYALYSKDNPLFEHVRKHKGLKKLVVDSKKTAEEFADANFAVEVQKEPFKEFLIEDAIEDALLPEVKLKSGGRVIIEETKAFVSIDVDSGNDKANGAVTRLNEEAAFEIAKQIRLRNLSGKIIIDFAGSSEYKFMKPAMEILEEEFKKDITKTRILGLSKAGNVEIIRTRRRPSLRDCVSAR